MIVDFSFNTFMFMEFIAEKLFQPPQDKISSSIILTFNKPLNNIKSKLSLQTKEVNLSIYPHS